MKTEKGRFKVGVVNDTPVNKEYDYEYRVFESLEEARQSSDWTDKALLEAINSNEKGSAKANEYQKVTAPFRPDTTTPEFKREAMIKTFVSTFGVPRELAEAQVDSLIAQGKSIG